MAKALLLGILVVVAAAVPAAESSREANLTLVNDCNYPVWPMVIPNDGSSPISGNTVRLDRRGGAAAFIIPLSSAWSGQVVARAGCAVETPCPSRCASGEELAAGDGGAAAVFVFEIRAIVYGWLR
nr:thaumatin-like protein [Setaria viridis]